MAWKLVEICSLCGGWLEGRGFGGDSGFRKAAQAHMRVHREAGEDIVKVLAAYQRLRARPLADFLMDEAPKMA